MWSTPPLALVSAKSATPSCKKQGHPELVGSLKVTPGFNPGEMGLAYGWAAVAPGSGRADCCTEGAVGELL